MNGTEPSVLLEQILTPEARERLARIKLEHPELTEQIEKQLVALALKWRGGRPRGGNRWRNQEEKGKITYPLAPAGGEPLHRRFLRGERRAADCGPGRPQVRDSAHCRGA